MLIYNKPHASTKRVLAYKLAHPSHSTSQIAKTLNLRYRPVYNILYTYKALGGEDTLGHLNDLVKDYASQKEEVPKGQKILRDVIRAESLKDAIYLSEKNNLHKKIDDLEKMIKFMAVQISGLENVIQYLEAKLGFNKIDPPL